MIKEANQISLFYLTPYANFTLQPPLQYSGWAWGKVGKPLNNGAFSIKDTQPHKAMAKL